MTKIFGVLALISICLISTGAAAAEDCGEIKGWHALVTLADACRSAGFPLEQDARIREKFKSFSNYADTLPDWKRGRTEERLGACTFSMLEYRRILPPIRVRKEARWQVDG
jgi:hypothetical protein